MKEKTYKLNKKLREKYNDKWLEGRPFIYIKKDHPKAGLEFIPIRLKKGLVVMTYVCSPETWDMMPLPMRKGFEKIV